jgi:hypothetical protein
VPLAEITFDLATKIIPKDQVIWAVFPGKSRRFLDQFVEQDAIFLDSPGIELRPQVLLDDDLLRKHLAMSEAIAEYRLGSSTSLPSRDATTYPVKRGASFNAAVGNVRNMFAKMKPGDLVIMGGKSIYQPVFAGEIVTPFDAASVLQTAAYPGEKIPYRSVRWLPVRTDRRFLSERLSHLLSNRKAVITVDRTEVADEIFKLAYGDYVFGENSRYIFPGPRYNNIATSTVPGIELISYLMAAVNARTVGELGAFSEMEIRSAISNYFEQDVLYSFEIDFASPGEYIVHARKAALALVVAVLVSATSGDISYAEAQTAKIVNSGDHANSPATAACNPIKIEEEYREIMDSLGASRFNSLCSINQDAQQGVGLHVPIKVKRTP